jgi:hypothetical protein
MWSKTSGFDLVNFQVIYWHKSTQVWDSHGEAKKTLEQEGPQIGLAERSLRLWNGFPGAAELLVA